MYKEQESVRQRIDETRSSLTQKIGTLENQVRDKVQNMKQNFNFKYQVEKRPWPFIGGSVVLGYVAANLIKRKYGQRSLRDLSFENLESMNQDFDRQFDQGDMTLPYNYQDQPRRQKKYSENWLSQKTKTVKNQFQDEIDMVKTMAVGAAMSLLGNKIKDSLPKFSNQIDKIINSAASKFGADSRDFANRSQSSFSGSRRNEEQSDFMQNEPSQKTHH